jgi:hypothetical protein
LSTSSSSKAKKKEKVSKFHRAGAAPAPTPAAVDAGAAHKPPAGEWGQWRSSTVLSMIDSSCLTTSRHKLDRLSRRIHEWCASGVT